MIMQPDAVTGDIIENAVCEVAKKNDLTILR